MTLTVFLSNTIAGPMSSRGRIASGENTGWARAVVDQSRWAASARGIRSYNNV
jgi:hypothetical protein